MNKLPIIISFLSVILIISYFSQKKHTIYGKVARKDHDIKKGLMFRKNLLKPDEGMLFEMNYQLNSMWMKNTYISLDIIFLDPNMNIIGFVENTKPLSLDSIMIGRKSKYILEMNHGSVKLHNMKLKDKINFIEKD